MTDESPIFVSQTELICALLGDLDRQYPGTWVNQATMNAIIQSATLIMHAANAGGLTRPKEPAA